MTEEAVAPTEEDVRSLEEKLEEFAQTLTPGERALLQAMRASQEDVQGYYPPLRTH